MTLRRRLALSCALAIGVIVVLAALASYLAVSETLYSQVDDALNSQAGMVEARPPRPDDDDGEEFRVPLPPSRLGSGAGIVQRITADGSVDSPPGALPTKQIPVSDQARNVAAGTAPSFVNTVEIGDEHFRVLTAPLEQGGAIQLARSIEPIQSTLTQLRVLLIIISCVGVLLGVLVGFLIARAVARPIEQIADEVDQVTETEDLSTRIEPQGSSETKHLAERFNLMLEQLGQTQAALASSLNAQRQLVADAAHELRTPLTSLRTNIELLGERDKLSEKDQKELLTDVEQQLVELGLLVSDLIELDRDPSDQSEFEQISLDELVQEAVERARRYSRSAVYTVHTEPTTVNGSPDRLSRAIDNLLVNAAVHGSGQIDVAVNAEGVTVRDHGAGIAEADLPQLFDRFYRAPDARSRPGSGLGLSIVKQVAEWHGGTVAASNDPDGGARFELKLPVDA